MSTGELLTIQRSISFAGALVIGVFVGLTASIPFWIAALIGSVCSALWSILVIYAMKPWVNEAKGKQ